MPKFIEVTGRDGVKRLINVNMIEEVQADEEGGATIYLAFNCPNAFDQDYVRTRESYSQIERMLLGGDEDGKPV